MRLFVCFWLVGWLVGWLGGWFVCWLVGWLCIIVVFKYIIDSNIIYLDMSLLSSTMLFERRNQ